MTMTPLTPNTRFTLLTTVLPGPDRKRQPAPYHYRLTYHNPDPTEPGCVTTWEVLGGRDAYQIALERLPGGDHRWHCTCPDAVYRGEENPDTHFCKHVRGLLELSEAVGSTVRCERVAA